MITSFIMMMITTIMFLGMSNSKNPMKMSFLILTSVSLMFLTIYKETGNSWFPLIFFILFTGGILMMFMILSSILPNEKSHKMKYPKSILMFMTIIGLMALTTKEFHMQSNFNFVKSLLSSSLFFILMTIVILLYFFNSIKLNSMEEYSMRSFQCR